MPAPDHRTLADLLLPSVLEAGQSLLGHHAAGVVAEQKADRTPVTAADRQAEAIVLAGLATAAPGVPVIAEEEVSAGRIPAFRARAFLVDALDGTREFVAGGNDFTVNIGLIDDGVPVFGLLFAPAAGRLFATFGVALAVEARVDPARLRQDGGTLATSLVFDRVRTCEPDTRAVRVLTSRSHLSAETERYLQRFSIASQRGIGSSLKMGMIAAGDADLYVRYGPTSEWDTAAGHAILLAAGGAVTLPDGGPLRYLTRPAAFLNPPFVAWGRASLLQCALA